MKLIKKIMTFVVVACAFVGLSVLSTKAAEVVAAEADFATISAKNSSYTNSWSYGDWTVSGGANNNGGWGYIKLGGKATNLDKLSDLFIASPVVSAEATKVVVNIHAGSSATSSRKVNSWGVYVYSDESMTNQIDYVAGGDITSAAAEFVFTPSEGTTWPANSYFKVKFEVTNTTTSNGVVWVDSVKVYKEAAEGLAQLAAPTVSVEGKVASWNAIEGAVEYNVGLYSSIDTEVVTYDVTTTNTSYDFSKFVSAGTWYVKVQAVADDVTALSSDYSSNEATFENTESTIVCTPTEFLTLIDPGQVNTYEVTGTLKAFYTSYAESTTNNYDSSYNNASFYLYDGTSKIIAYRVKGAEGANLQVGDIVTVSGKLQNYNGVNQIPANGTYLNITPACAAEFEEVSTKSSLKLAVAEEEISSVAIRFGVMIDADLYDSLVARGAEFGVAVIKKATLGESSLADVIADNAYACATVARVNELGEADENGAYYQFSFVLNNVPESDWSVELVAACYVLIDGNYFVAGTSTQSVQSVAQAYVNADDTSAYAEYLAYLNKLAGN